MIDVRIEALGVPANTGCPVGPWLVAAQHNLEELARDLQYAALLSAMLEVK